jgi:hypothetical protein
MGIERDEFQSAVAIIREDIHGVHSRLDALNGRTRRNESAIAVLEDRGKDARKLGAAWGGFIGGAVMVAAWLAERLWK